MTVRVFHHPLTCTHPTPSYSKEQPAHPEVVFPCDGIYDEDQDEVRYYTRDELETLRGGGSVHGG